MLNRVLSILDGLDVEKAVEVVDLVWDDREKIIEAVDLVWENRDQLAQVLEFVRDNKDRIIGMLDDLPEMLGKTGGYIEAAGASAIKASAFLTGENDDDDSISAHDLAELAANALERCYTELQSAANIVDGLGSQLDGITIPSIKPEYIEVMGFNVIGGIELGESNLIDDAGEQLRNGSDRLKEVGKDLGAVAIHMRKLGAALTETGGDLKSVGGQLQQSGGMLRTLSGTEFTSISVSTSSSASAKKSTKAAPKKKPPKKKRPKKKGSPRGKGAAARKKAQKRTKKKVQPKAASTENLSPKEMMARAKK